MTKLRQCASAQLNTGTSKCPLDMGKMIGAIIVPQGTTLPADLTADSLEELAHADEGERICGILRFAEYAKNGGEAQTSANGYGPEKFNGFSARKDTFTMDEFHPELDRSLNRSANVPRGVYFFNEDNYIFGVDGANGTLEPFDMSSIYSDATPFPSSSAKATMNVTFCHAKVKQSIENYNFAPLGFDPSKLVLGLTEVVLEKQGESGYKLYEKTGKLDVTGIYGPLIATAGASVLDGSTAAATYDAASKALTITGNGTVSLKSPATLYEKGIKGIVQVPA